MASSLSRKTIKKFSISYNEAKSLGITDEDLKYISEISPKKYRVSVPNPSGKRKTKVIYDLLDAIQLKYDFVRVVQAEVKKYNEMNTTLKSSKSKLTKYNTVRDGIELYLKDREEDYKREIIQRSTYEHDVNDYLNSVYLRESGIYDKIIDDIDDEAAQEFVDYLLDLKKKNGNKLAENTIYKPFSFIHKVFNYFVKDLKIITFNPFDSVKKKPKAVPQDKDYFSEEEMHYVHEKVEFENIRFRTLIILMLDGGLRKEEALAIKFGDVNNLRKTLKISRAVVISPLNGELIVKPVKTKNSKREIVLTNHCLDLIEKYKKFKEACGFVVNDSDFVFTSWESLDLIMPERYTAEFSKFLKRINMKHIPLKNLRTTNATFFVAKGQNLKAVQKHAGHSTFDTTMTFYAQTNLNEERKLVNTYEEEFYNKLGLTVPELYKVVSNRFTDKKRLIGVIESLSNMYIDDSNYDVQLERCVEYFRELFPIFDKILKIDSLLDEDDIDCIFSGYTEKYLSIKIEPLKPSIKI